MIVEVKLYIDTEKDNVDINKILNPSILSAGEEKKSSPAKKITSAKRMKKKADDLKTKADEIIKEEIRAVEPAEKVKPVEVSQEQEKLQPLVAPPQVEGEKQDVTPTDIVDVTPVENDALKVSTLPPKQILTHKEELDAKELLDECQKITLASVSNGTSDKVLKIMKDLGIVSLSSASVNLLAEFKELAIKMVEANKE